MREILWILLAIAGLGGAAYYHQGVVPKLKEEIETLEADASNANKAVKKLEGELEKSEKQVNELQARIAGGKDAGQAQLAAPQMPTPQIPASQASAVAPRAADSEAPTATEAPENAGAVEPAKEKTPEEEKMEQLETWYAAKRDEIGKKEAALTANEASARASLKKAKDEYRDMGANKGGIRVSEADRKSAAESKELAVDKWIRYLDSITEARKKLLEERLQVVAIYDAKRRELQGKK